MDFLTNLYSNDNFGIILFITISILVLAFLIVLFFGKKDQKERKLAETKSLEVNNTLAQNAFTDSQPTVQLNIDPDVFEHTKEKEEEETTVPEVAVENISVEPPLPPIMESHSYSLPTDFMEPENNTMNSEEISQDLPPKMDFDFDALADSISKELESISANESVSNIKNETNDYEKNEENKVEPIVDEVKFDIPTQLEEVKPVIVEEKEVIPQFEAPAKPKMPSPTQFSSVFVSKKKETKPVESYEPVKPVIETPSEPVMPQVTPAKPNIELPKTIDLPKLNTNPNTNNNSKIVFSSLEDDIPAYHNDSENRM